MLKRCSLKCAVLLTMLCLSFLPGCATQSTLYEELGRQPGLDRIAARFIANIDEDKHIRMYFQHSNLERFYRLFSEHLCVVADGPCRYSGDNMIATHTGMEISEADFDRTVDLLINSMNQAGVSFRVQNRLLSRLAPLRSEIIYR